MDLGLFCKGLESALVRRGIPSENAKRQVATLAKTFTDEDLTEIENITSGEEIEEIAAGIASILAKNKPAPRPANSVQTEESYLQPERTESPAPPSSFPASKPAQNAADFFAPPESADKTARGSAIFWGCFILGLPFIFAVLALIIALFGLCYIALIGAIIGFVLALIAIVAVGCGVSLVGIIYGITQLFSFVAAGVYEIGLGLMVAGMVLFTAVLLYNAAVRFLPWVMRCLTMFFEFVFGKLRHLFYVVRRECYKL